MPLAIALGLAFLGPAGLGRAAAPVVYVTTIDTDIVTPVLAQWIEEVIKRAEEEGAEAVVIQLDTPGGLLTATHDIVKDIMTATVPVIVYVGPSGSRATSAGTFITVAAHVAVMAPGTSIGAAHPVNIDGTAPDDKKDDPRDSGPDALRELLRALQDAYGDEQETAKEGAAEEGDESAQDAAAQEDTAAPAVPPERDPAREAQESAPSDAPAKPRQQQETGKAMGDKILNDTVAWARTIAQTRGRNADWIEEAIVESASLTEDEALDRHVIDFIAEDVPDILQRADGREIRLPGGRTVTLRTAVAEARALDMTLRYRFLGALAHPQILLLLLSLGGLGLTMELFNPNGITGIIGAVCLILAYFGLQTLPINVAGILLLLLALVLLIAEFKVVSYGLLTLGAMVCFTLGGLMLIDSPEEVLRLQLGDVLPISLAMGVVAGFLVVLVVRAQRPQPFSGEHAMVGLEGVVRETVDPRGKIEARGELWSAVSASRLPVGARVRVCAIDGLTVTVEPLAAAAASVANDEGAA